MLERRTRLPKLVITDAELSYPLEFDENQEILFLSFSLSDLRGINVSYTRANRESTHVNTYMAIFVDDSDICCALAKELSLVLNREGSSLLRGPIRIFVPDANLNVRNPQTDLAAVILLLSVLLVLIGVDIARLFKRLLHEIRNLLMRVENAEGLAAYNDSVVGCLPVPPKEFLA